MDKFGAGFWMIHFIRQLRMLLVALALLLIALAGGPITCLVLFVIYLSSKAQKQGASAPPPATPPPPLPPTLITLCSCQSPLRKKARLN